MRQVAGNGPLAEKERGGDLAIRLPFGNEGRDAALGRREPFGPLSTSQATQLGARLRGPARGSDLFEPIERSLDRLACGHLLAEAASCDAERQQGTCPAKGVADLLVLFDRPRQLRERVLDVAS